MVQRCHAGVPPLSLPSRIRRSVVDERARTWRRTIGNTAMQSRSGHQPLRRQPAYFRSKHASDRSFRT